MSLTSPRRHSTAPAGTMTASAQAPVNAGSRDQRGAADDSSARTSTRQTEYTARSEDRRKAESSERDVHLGDQGHSGSSGANKEKVEFPDGGTFAKYKATGGPLELTAWRRQNVDGVRSRCAVGRSWTSSVAGFYRPGFQP